MIVTITSAIPAGHHQVLRQLVDVGFAGVAHHDVEVHVRSRPPRVGWTVHYRLPVAELPPELARRWLAAHPGATSVDVARSYPRRRDAVAAADRLQGSVRRHVEDRLAERMSACAYYSLPPRLVRVRPGTRYLVTMRLPQRLEALSYPQELQYRRGGVPMPTAPVVQVHDWLEELVHLAAHEARHVAQLRLGLTKSEVDAERWAAAAVERYRSLRLEGHRRVATALRR